MSDERPGYVPEIIPEEQPKLSLLEKIIGRFTGKSETVRRLEKESDRLGEVTDELIVQTDADLKASKTEAAKTEAQMKEIEQELDRRDAAEKSQPQ